MDADFTNTIEKDVDNKNKRYTLTYQLLKKKKKKNPLRTNLPIFPTQSIPHLEKRCC